MFRTILQVELRKWCISTRNYKQTMHPLMQARFLFRLKLGIPQHNYTRNGTLERSISGYIHITKKNDYASDTSAVNR